MKWKACRETNEAVERENMLKRTEQQHGKAKQICCSFASNKIHFLLAVQRFPNRERIGSNFLKRWNTDYKPNENHSAEWNLSVFFSLNNFLMSIQIYENEVYSRSNEQIMRLKPTKNTLIFSDEVAMKSNIMTGNKSARSEKKWEEKQRKIIICANNIRSSEMHHNYTINSIISVAIVGKAHLIASSVHDKFTSGQKCGVDIFCIDTLLWSAEKKRWFLFEVVL